MGGMAILSLKFTQSILFGSIVSENFEVCCGEGSIKVLSIQREGKRVQQINEFLLGTQIKKGANIA